MGGSFPLMGTGQADRLAGAAHCAGRMVRAERKRTYTDLYGLMLTRHKTASGRCPVPCPYLSVSVRIRPFFHSPQYRLRAMCSASPPAGGSRARSATADQLPAGATRRPADVHFFSSEKQSRLPLPESATSFRRCCPAVSRTGVLRVNHCHSSGRWPYPAVGPARKMY